PPLRTSCNSSPLLFPCYPALRDLHSFPTRRSSDLNAWNQVRECLRQNLIVMMLVDRHDVLSRTPAHLMNERGTARQGQPSTPRAPLGCLQEALKLFGPHERKLVGQHIAFRC